MSEKEFEITEEEKETMSKRIRTRCVGRYCKDGHGRGRDIPGTWSYYYKFGNYCVTCIAKVNSTVYPQKAEDYQKAKERREEIKRRLGVTD